MGVLPPPPVLAGVCAQINFPINYSPRRFAAYEIFSDVSFIYTNEILYVNIIIKRYTRTYYSIPIRADGEIL